VGNARRVVITGSGVVTAAGAGRDAFWQRALEGRSSIGAMESYATDPPGCLVGEVRGVDLTAYFANKRLLKMVGRRALMCVAASVLMMEDAGAAPGTLSADDTGIYLGDYGALEGDPRHLVKALSRSRDEDGRLSMQKLGMSGLRALNPLNLLMNIPNAPTAHVSMQHNVRGLSNTYLTNFTASALAIGEAAEVIRAGRAQQMVVGGVGILNAVSLMEFSAFGLICGGAGEAARAVRPFDADACGFAPAEGAALLLLEELETAQRRGARVRAEITGYGWSFVPSVDDLVPDAEGVAIGRAIDAAMTRARLTPADIDCVVASGLAHPAFDLAEGRAVCRLVERGARPHISAVSPVAGHLQGGMTALQAATASMIIETGAIPPIPNHVQPRPELARLAFVTKEPVRRDVRNVVISALGLGGQAAALVLSACWGNGGGR